MNDFKKLQSRINLLENTIDGQNMEAVLLQSELTETLKPSVSSYELNMILMEMLEETMAYQKRNGRNEKAVKSQERILKALELSSSLSNLSDANHRLKLINGKIHSHYQRLRVQLREQRLQMETIKKSENF